MGIMVQLMLFDRLLNLNIFSDYQNFDFTDPFYEDIFSTISSIVIGAIATWQCKLHKVKIEYLIGNIPSKYNWKNLILLSISAFFFSYSVKAIGFYLTSFAFPIWVESRLVENVGIIQIKESFAPVIYAVAAYGFFSVINVSVYLFVYHGIFTHRFVSKWGVRRGIIYLILFICLPNFNSPVNTVSHIIYLLIDYLLYLKTKTIKLLIVFNLFILFIDVLIEVIRNFLGRDLISVAQLQSEIGFWLIAISITTPYLIYWFKHNWLKRDLVLPYFANANVDRVEESSLEY